MIACLPFRTILVALACAVVAGSLGGCGRKGHLDLPPQAQGQPQQKAQVTEAPDDVAVEQPFRPGSIVDQVLTDDEPVTPRGRKRKFVLDPLLAD